LKPDNILIAADGSLKLTDFGLSQTGAMRRAEESASKHGSDWFSTRRFTGSLSEMSASWEQGKLRHSSSGDDETLIVQKKGRPGQLAPTAPNAMVPSNAGRTWDSLHSSAAESSDRGAAGLHGKLPNFYSPVGTANYIAPEVILGIGHTASVDYWSLGCLAFQLLVGFAPFSNASDDVDQTYQDIIDRNIHWPTKVKLSKTAVDLIGRLLTLQPNKRLGANGAIELREHAFFTGIDWTKVYGQNTRFIPEPSSPEDTSYFEPPVEGEFADLDKMQREVDDAASKRISINKT
jgi:serine/threonine-protein kinase RIM15